MSWQEFLRPGDWGIALLSAALCTASFPLIWRHGQADRAIVRRGGEVFAELDLSHNRKIEVPGPLGITTIAIEGARARVVSDPGPRQYCVRQGWLDRIGEIAICAPNEVSIEIAGKTRPYDSLNY